MRGVGSDFLQDPLPGGVREAGGGFPFALYFRLGPPY